LLAAQMLEYERSCLGEYDLVGFSSEVDQSLLGRWVRRGVVLENGVDTRQRPFLRDLPSAPCVLFPGSLEYWPNVDALGYFLDAVFPKIIKAVPDARLQIAGYSRSDPSHLIPARFREHVVATSNPRDMAPHFAAARAVVVPLRFGSGSRLKILEAMAMGRPVIATPTGAEGLKLEEDVHFLCADTPAEYAWQVERILRDDTLAERLRRSARSYVASRYDWSIVIRPFLESMENI
jgi:glycosyltransferase involved in cell wall biosynthesis